MLVFFSLSSVLSVLASSRASPLPQGNAFQMWERACSRMASPLTWRPCPIPAGGSHHHPGTRSGGCG
ncbi:hypothetical protein C5612_01070 [Pseudomonas frederiksbergensis]|uniref:Uncharacterized protein n=1 Tax=Pseudomonas frederiksbergensis TaxID=104087 RepID=A0A2S8HVC9_9PSED|nr:hypothetical protein C5612_01070 [Pseudomonas frederiksbergensis]